MALIIHHLQNSQSERILWLCEELNIPYELKLYQRHPLLSPPDLAELHPLKAAPVVDDTTVSPAVRLAESPAIIEYIIMRHGKGRLALPPDHKDYAQYLYWIAFPQGTLQPSLGRLLVLDTVAVPRTDPRVSHYTSRLSRALSYLNDHLSSPANTWLAGSEFSAADIMTVFSLTTMRTFVALDLSEYKAILGYLERVAGREGYKRAMEKGDPQIDWKAQMTGPGPELFGPLREMAAAMKKKEAEGKGKM